VTDNVVEFPKPGLDVDVRLELDDDEISMITAFLTTQINGLVVSADISMESAVYACLRAAAHAALEDGWTAEDFEAFCKSTEIQEIQVDA
tara:strand:- start:48 stop:317 length:270 start_codon:yes stop_codon:yes gene_type:complete